MTDEPKPAAQPQAPPQQQQVQIPVDAANRDTVYTNFVQANMNANELYLELGTWSQTVAANGGPDPILLTHRVIMNFVTAKQLAELLKRAVNQHEQMFGGGRGGREPPAPRAAAAAAPAGDVKQ
jgi:hypothetical protein